jgi:hypothetical protein
MPTREQAVADFIRHNEAVCRDFPSERLLIYEAKQGWEPLCQFLTLSDTGVSLVGTERLAAQQSLSKAVGSQIQDGRLLRFDV